MPALQLLLTVGLCCYFGLIPGSGGAGLLTVLTLSTQISLYIFGYRSLRNLNAYFLWMAVAVGHLIAYFCLRHVYTPMAVHPTLGLRDTIVLLLLFQVLRLASLVIQHKEPVSPSRVGYTDMYDGRRVTALDVILFMIYLLATLLPLFV